MTEQEYIQKIHEEILGIMDAIHEICVSHHLKYYLIGGSLLGAVRHKGFIPWDDDLDIAMPRYDYDRFLDICSDCLQNNYAVENMERNPDFCNFFSKLYKTDTLFSEALFNGTQTHIGIFVDIFPLDETNGNIKQLSFRKRLMWSIYNLIYEKRHPGHLNGIKKFIAHGLSLKRLTKMLHSVVYVSNHRNRRYYTNFASQYPVERKTQLKTVYGNGTPIQFEDRMYMAPDDYKTDLLSNFGPKYMELPPVEKRRTHYPVKVVFSDGSVFEPVSMNSKVSVEESIDW